MAYLRLMIFAVSVLVFQSLCFAQSPTSSFSCNFAKVKETSNLNTAVSVRAGAGPKFRRVDKLQTGQEVYICDESGDWFKVFYSKPDGPCGSASKNGLDMQRAKGCRSGWVEKKSIDVISG